MRDMNNCEKLPELIELDDYSGVWEEYENELYNIFKSSFIDTKQYFQGKPIGIFTEAMYHGKEKTFWHIISEGNNEYDRNPELRRCERIAWIKPLIELLICDKCTSIYKWKNKHRNKKYRYKLWCKKTNFIVILEERNKCFMLITAYIVKYKHSIEKLEKEYSISEKL
ncbi:hypothetical protein [Clostridium cadaveris]|uniref:hypothetical protein n=1 Tax=Clostridium cadaveris TaxID=1529 RepID=UPI0003F673E5|nr:hypothetical protein [Clostridium cadaveris]